MHTFPQAFLFALAIGLTNAASAAAQGVYTSDDGELTCGFTGSITKADVAEFEKNAERGCKTVAISSTGGEVHAAMAIGHVVRAKQLTVAVRGDGACSSSCVLIYAGGVVRAPFGPVQIHRPYLPTNSDSFQSTQRHFDRLASKMTAYLRSMNVSERLYHLMMEVEPQKIRVLTLEEMDGLNMGWIDPVYQEHFDNKDATKLGMSKQQYLRAKAKASEACGAIQGILDANQTANLERTRACWRREFPGYLSSAGSAQ